MSAQALYIRYGEEKIAFTRVARHTSHASTQIKVHPDGRVVVHAPENASDNAVALATRKRARWIHEQLRTFREQSVSTLPRRYISGESHLYLGRRYVLKVIVDTKSPPAVKLLRGTLQVSLRQKDPQQIRALLESWYKERAKEVFARRLETLLPQTLWVKKVPDMRVHTMKTQWGSCSPKGRLTLNPLLVKAPRECIDYVLLHELCHIAEHNHSPNFYRRLRRVMPDWEKIKLKLDNEADQIFAI